MHTYPSFVDNMTFYAMDCEKSQLEQKDAMLKNLTSVFNLSTHDYDDLNGLFQKYLDAGREVFGLETGIVSKISDAIYTVIDVASTLDVIQRGDQYPIEGTYCHEVYSCNKVIGFPHVGDIDYMKDHPVYVNLKLEAYLSAPIEVDGEVYGTLNFSSTRIRENGFSEHERDLITLMSKSLGTFIAIHEKDKRLKAANVKLKKFVGYVAHDLRNPLGIIQSMAKAGLKKETPQERIPFIFDRIHLASSGALSFVYSILDLAALGTGKVTANLKSVQLSYLIDTALDQLAELRNAANSEVVLDFESDLPILVDEKLMIQVFVNLFTNAFKYSPMQSQIKIQAAKLNSGTIISISNPIDTNIHSRIEDNRYRSIGFGLEFATEIVSAHSSELVMVDKGGVFTASFTI